MNQNLRALVAAESAAWSDEPTTPRRSPFSVELDRRGLFLRFGRVEAYLCTEVDGAWTFYREPGGFDAQAGRLHLVVGTPPT
jgi:hypothetical protein